MLLVMNIPKIKNEEIDKFEKYFYVNIIDRSSATNNAEISNLMRYINQRCETNIIKKYTSKNVFKNH